MERRRIAPRDNWQQIVSEQGLLYHSPEGRTYWDESVYYQFSLKEIELIESATNELYEMYLKAGQYVIDKQLFSDMQIPERLVPYIVRSWNEEPPSLYGRFDLAYSGDGDPKLLEFNADTPTALIEAAVVQWYWKEDLFKREDQFNSIHEKLVDKWKDIAAGTNGETVYFCHMDDWEDWMTVSYLRDTAARAGITTSALLMEEIGWNEDDTLRDLDENQIRCMFKLYPWEWLASEIPSGKDEAFHRIRWIEPAWRLLWSNKAMLAVLWHLYPGHRLLLESRLDGPSTMQRYAKKPFLSREGANVQLFGLDRGEKLEREGPYGDGGWVYQALGPIPSFEGKYPVIGSWYITDQGAAGMGIRESDSMITDNLSRFAHPQPPKSRATTPPCDHLRADAHNNRRSCILFSPHEPSDRAYLRRP